jgi:hypothetical protein
MRLDKSLGMLCSLIAAVSVAPIASAATVTNIDSTITNAGSCTAITGCPESYIVTPAQGATTQVVNVPPKQSFGFTDSFNQSSNVATGSNLGASATGSGGPWNFQDNILFTTNGGVVQAQASATLSDVTGLQARIVALNNPMTGTPFDVSSAASASALLGAGAVTILDGWQNFTNPIAGVDFTGILPNSLPAGAYILQIRGEAAAGSSYSGTMTFTPVPLPPAGWLLLSALAGIGALVLRRPKTPMIAATPA